MLTARYLRHPLRFARKNSFWLNGSRVSVRGEKFIVHSRSRKVWQSTAAERWEPETLDILDAHLSPQTVLWDIGAYLGQISLYASRKCRRVVAFEPDPDALQQLIWNARRNRADNIAVVGAALAAESGICPMAPALSQQYFLGRSTTSFLLSPDARESFLAPAFGRAAWEDLIRAEPPDFIKMDIEGGEFELLPAMSDFLASHRPKLMLALHAHFLRNRGKDENEADKNLARAAAALKCYGECLDLHSNESFPAAELTGAKLKNSGCVFLR